MPKARSSNTDTRSLSDLTLDPQNANRALSSAISLAAYVSPIRSTSPAATMLTSCAVRVARSFEQFALPIGRSIPQTQCPTTGPRAWSLNLRTKGFRRTAV